MPGNLISPLEHGVPPEQEQEQELGGWGARVLARSTPEPAQAFGIPPEQDDFNIAAPEFRVAAVGQSR